MSGADASKSSPDDALAASAGGSFSDQLAALQAVADEAKERRAVAKAALRRRFDAAQEVTADLVKFRDDVAFKRDSAPSIQDQPARARELTDAFLNAVRERGLVLRAIGSVGGVEIVDPAAMEEFNAADAAMTEASRSVRNFESRHATDLDAERKAADADRIKDVLAGDDGDAIREVLAPAVSAQAAMTSADLRPGVHRRHAVIGG